MILLLLAACQRPAPPCPEPRTLGWEPVLTTEVRVDEASAEWGSDDGAVLDPVATAGCGAPPCLEVTGPGTAEAHVTLNRGTAHRLTGTLAATAPARVRVIQRTETGLAIDLALADFPAGGPFAVDLSFTVDSARTDSFVVVEPGEGSAILDDLSLVGETWGAVDDPPGAELLLGFLIHIEQDVTFDTAEDRWALRARVLTGLSGVLGAHGAKLGIQPDATFVQGARVWDPGWMGDRSVEGAGWSVHTHADDESDIGRAVRGAVDAFEGQHFSVTDLNGGFEAGDWADAAAAGMTSLTAYKDAASQAGLPLGYVQPWRPPDGSGDPEAFATHDPAGPLVYLPGSPVKEVDHPRYPEFVARVLSQALAHARPGYVNTWYFVLHVDRFGPDDPDGLAAYFEDGSFERDLAEYDRMLTEVTDPLVDDGVLRYATPTEMADAATAWEETCQVDG